MFRVNDILKYRDNRMDLPFRVIEITKKHYVMKYKLSNGSIRKTSWNKHDAHTTFRRV